MKFNIYSRYSFRHEQKSMRILWVFFLLFFIGYFKTAWAQDNPDKESLFDILSSVSKSDRIARATTLYKDHYRKVNPQWAMQALDTLQNIAVNLNDLQLQCAVPTFRADYYSVNRGFNPLSTQYYQQAIAFATEHDMPVETAVYLHIKGLYYFTFNHNTEACKYFLVAYQKFKAIGFNHVPGIAVYLMEQARFYYDLKDFDTAKTLLQVALRYPLPNLRDRINATNTIGLIYRSYKQYPQAISYFNAALNLAERTKDTAWVSITKGNIGSVYFMQGDYKKAQPLILTDYKTSIRYTDSVNAAIALLRLSYISLQKNDITQASVQLNTVAALIVNKKYALNLNSLVELYNQRVLLYQKIRQPVQEIEYLKKYQSAKDSLAKRNNTATIENVKLKWEAQNSKSQITQLEEAIRTAKFKRNAVVFILFLLTVIIILIINRQRLKAIQGKQLLLVEKRLVDYALKNAAASLQQYTENMRQNNMLIEKFKKEIAHFKEQSTDRKLAQHLEKLLQARIMTDATWDEFKKLFTRVHTGFFIKLRKAFPKLTDTDMRLLSLLRLGLNNREMANMLGVTVEGVKKAKQRMRKKMDLPADQEIEQVIAAI